MHSPDAARKQLVGEWLALAEDNLASARDDLATDRPYLWLICHNAQQAAEKYLKAYLTYQAVEPPRTHDIQALLDLMAAVDAARADVLRGATALTPYGVDVRYPGWRTPLDRGEALRALELATGVRDAVLAALSPDV